MNTWHKYMTYMWHIHTTYTCTWHIHDKCMTYMWHIHDIYTCHIHVHDISMRYTHGIYMTYTWQYMTCTHDIQWTWCMSDTWHTVPWQSVSATCRQVIYKCHVRRTRANIALRNAHHSSESQSPTHRACESATHLLVVMQLVTLPSTIKVI